MSVKLSNIKIEEVNYDKKNFKDFDKCAAFVNLIAPDYKIYLPKNPSHTVQFELNNSNSDFANCIRRFLLDEINVYSMHVNTNNITTDDKFILSDLVKKNIELVPFTQKLNEQEYANLKLNINKTNTTDDIITVYTRDIKITDKNNKELKQENYFSMNIPIINLRPNTTIEIKEISTTNGCAKQDAGKFCLLSNLSYEIMDIKPLNESKYNREGVSSFVSNPKQFYFKYKTQRNIEPKKIMNICCDQMHTRFTDILNEIKKINNENTYFSDLLELETKGDIKIYHLKNEYWTIANVIARYCYLEFPDIKFVCGCIIHPSIEESIVKLRHNESNKILINSIKKIINDITIVKKNIFIDHYPN